MAKKKTTKKEEEEKLTSALVKQMLGLATSGFGLVAALAWNDAIKSFIEEYVKPYVAQGEATIWQFLYAILITALIVTFTYYLTKIQQKLSNRNNKK